MLRNKPAVNYCGLTVVLSNESRFDVKQRRLLSATGGLLFNDFCLRPELNVMQCDIRIADDKSDFLPGTKCILLLGEYALHSWIPESRNNTLNEVRGSLFNWNGIPVIASYYPQDAADIKDDESRLNPEHKEFNSEDDDEEDGDEVQDSKKHGATKRQNYAFWIRADCKKCKSILSGGIPKSIYPPAAYHIHPNSEVIIKLLTETKGAHLYFDMETDYEEQNMQCFAFSFDGINIYSVPVLDYNYKWAYTRLPHIFKALTIAIRNNTIVAHNGAGFDFFVLGYKYHIPINLAVDTMAINHRIFPDIEKSLGHCISYWTWERFHKDEDSRGYRTQTQMTDRMKYCGKDVYTMFLVYQEQMKYAKTIPGLVHSIDTVNSSIRPYLTTSLQGIRVDYEQVRQKRKENDRLMMQYLRIINLLIGEKGMKEVQSCIKSKARSFPGSNPQCCEYFHEILGYPKVAYGKKKKDGTRGPSLAKQALFKLRLKHENPVIDFSIAYRQIALETSTPLGFTPWKDDNNKIVNAEMWEG